MTLNVRIINNQAETIKDVWGKIARANQEFNKNLGIMTDYEKQRIGGEIQTLKNQYMPAIKQMVITEMNEAIDGYTGALARVEKARQVEAAQWEPTKLAAELTVFHHLTNMAMAAPAEERANRLEALYKDAMRSEDRYKMRAAAENMLTLKDADLPLTDRVRVGVLSKNAESNLYNLRQSAEIGEAITAAQAALNNLWQVREAERQGLTAAGEADPTNLMNGTTEPHGLPFKRILQHPNGQVEILPADHPDVIGFTVEVMEKVGS
jgi:hypothetical protein